MPIEPTPIEAVPSPVPSTDDPSNFDSRADAMMEWFETGVPGIDQAAQDTYENALEVYEATSDIAAAALVAADAAGYVGKSTTTLSVSAGNKDVVLSSAKASLLVANKQVVIVLDSDASVKMFGVIAASPAPTSTTARVVVTSGGVFGTGSFSGWKVIDAAFFASSATATEVREGTSDAAPMTPLSIYDALEEVELDDGANIYTDGDSELDMSKFINAVVTLAGNRNLPNPTNATPGKTGRIRVVQDGTGSRTLTFDTNWKRQGGDPTLSTPAASNDIIVYDVVTSTFILYDLIKSPS